MAGTGRQSRIRYHKSDMYPDARPSLQKSKCDRRWPLAEEFRQDPRQEGAAPVLTILRAWEQSRSARLLFLMPTKS